MPLVSERTYLPPPTIVKRLPECHTCHERKAGLFTLDVQHKPICADCARKAGKPID